MKSTNRFVGTLGTLLAALSIGSGAQAQTVTGTVGSPSATTTVPNTQLPPPDPKFGGTIKDGALQSKPWWAPRVVPPQGAPNVLLIITDDAGFGVPSTFGGVIPTPTMDRMAKEGLRYNRMFSTALCSPTRAALITGRNHHSVGFGVISEQSTGFPGYNSIIDRDKATIGRMLVDNGYSHRLVRQGPQRAGFRRQPGRALRPVARRHGLRILLRLRRRRCQPVAAEPVPQHHADLSVPGQAAGQLEPDHGDGRRRHRLHDAHAPDPPDKPIFIKYAPGATHAPHHPTKEWVDKIAR
jgi:hypothetical protein